MTTLLDLLDNRPAPSMSRDLPLEQRFNAWRQRTPEVVEDIEHLAIAAVANGAKRLSAKKMIEDARERFHRPINNDLSPALARWLAEQHPEMDGLFKTRERRAT